MKTATLYPILAISYLSTSEELISENSITNCNKFPIKLLTGAAVRVLAPLRATGVSAGVGNNLAQRFRGLN